MASPCGFRVVRLVNRAVSEWSSCYAVPNNWASGFGRLMAAFVQIGRVAFGTGGLICFQVMDVAWNRRGWGRYGTSERYVPSLTASRFHER